MKCFRHAQSEAVGICKHCSKGVCSECANDTGFGVVCSPGCKDEVIAIRAMIERNKRAFPIAPKTHARNALFLALFGLAFVTFGLTQRNDWFLLWFLCAIGFIMFLGAIFSFLNARKLAKLSQL